MTTDKYLLNLNLDEIRSIKLPKIDYVKDTKVRKLPSDIVTELNEFWNLISENGIIAPNTLRNYLREIGQQQKIQIYLIFNFRFSSIEYGSFPSN